VASAEPDDPPRQAAEAEPEDAIPAAQPTAPAEEHPEPEGERALLPPRKVNVERLLRLLAVETVAMEAVDELITGDAGLALGLLEVARTVPPGGPAPDLSSIRKALLHVTRSNVRLWAAHLEQAPFADRHERETSSMVLIRAHFCQGLAVLTGAVDHEEAFLAGLLAGVVDLMGIHAVAVLERYAASPEVAGALVDGTGPLAGIVAVARAHGTSGTAAHQAKLSPLEVMRAYLDAVSTTSRTMRTADGEESDTDPVVARPGQGELRRRLRASRD
jgi:EAL and modified HD-GYP domain-containing signal transduction protein